MTKMTARHVVVAAMALTMTGCTTAKKHHFSGFLEDYSKLTPSPVDKGALSYRNPDADFNKYDKIHVQPVSVHFAHAADEQSVSPERLEQYKEMVRDALGDALAEHDLDASSQGANVAELRFQVANVRLTRVIESPPTVYRAQRYQMGSANAEAVLVDGGTGTVLGIYVGDTVAPEWVESWSEQEAWALLETHTRRAIKRWVSTWAPKFSALSQSTTTSQGEEEVE